MKPFHRIQLVKIQPDQSRSGQVGSESCLSPGDRRERSVDSEIVGHEDSAPKSLVVADAEVLGLAEGRILTTDNARSLRAAGVSSPGHAITRTLQELGKTSQSPPAWTGMVHLTAKDRDLAGTDAPSRERISIGRRGN